MSSSVEPGPFEHLVGRRDRAVSISRGSAPASAKSTKRARGVSPSSSARSSLMISTAAAPSVICDELPAVTRPPLGRRGTPARAATSVSTSVSRTPSSRVTGSPSARRPATISPRSGPRRPPARASAGLAAERVHLVAVDRPLVGDQLGRDALRHQPALVGVARAEPRAERVAVLAVGHRRAHRHPGHHLDTAGDDDVVRAGDHALGREVRGLLARPALAVDGRAGHRLGPPGGEHGVAGDVDACSPTCITQPMTTSSITPGRRPCALERAERLGGEVDRMPVASLPLRLPSGVRTASTITASRMSRSLVAARADRATAGRDRAPVTWPSALDRRTARETRRMTSAPPQPRSTPASPARPSRTVPRLVADHPTSPAAAR